MYGRYHHYGNKKLKRAIRVIALLSFAAVLFILFELRVEPIIREIAVAKAKSVAVRTISDAVNETMKQYDIQYSDLVSFEKNGENNITAVKSNVVEINRLKAQLTGSIENKISDVSYMTAYVPLGNLLGQSLLMGMGPSVKIKMIPMGYASIDITNDFSSAGINQTKHEISLKVKCDISVLLPISSEIACIETQMPVAQTIIVGTVPDTYTHVTGQENPEDTVLNMVP